MKTVIEGRRAFLGSATALLGTVWFKGSVSLAEAVEAAGKNTTPRSADLKLAPAQRFPHFQSEPVSYLHVKMQDSFWAPRQTAVREVSVNWITHAHDPAGGLEQFKKDPTHYVTQVKPGEMEHVKFIEAMATVVGVQRDPAIIGMIDAWAKPLIEGQAADGYLAERFAPGLDRPPQRWQTVYWSHEDFMIGNYIEAALAHREVTGEETFYRSAVRAADNMVTEVLNAQRVYVSGHPEIEQALMRLYGETGDTRYLRLCGWLLDQRGHHEGRPSYGRSRLDDIPIKQQRAIEGHAVMAGFLFNGVTQYVGATGDTAYRDAVLAVWDDFVERRMYLHGGGGNSSSRNEGYRNNPYCILPDDAYCESCSVWANFQWAHNLFRLTADARHIDTAEQMLYNAFYASLSLKGNSSYYQNVMEAAGPHPRLPELATSCCPPNIVKLFSKVGGYFYSTDADGIFVKHYGASEATVPWRGGVELTQHTHYPWDGKITVQVDPKRAGTFALRLRRPAWAKSHTLTVNGRKVEVVADKGWLVVHRSWKAGDRVDLDLPMSIERVTLPAEFAEYRDKVALQRGPIVYCLEEQDQQSLPDPNYEIAELSRLETVYIPPETTLEAQHRPDFLNGVTVLRGEVRQLAINDSIGKTERPLAAMFVPYGVWANRTPGAMKVWLGARRTTMVELLGPASAVGQSCVG